MVTTHRTPAGGWALCDEPESCALRFHFPDTTPGMMALVPEAVLWDLLEIVEPPYRGWRGAKAWYEDGREPVDVNSSKLHRGYDLPALIMEQGRVLWYRHGLQHRGGGKPAVIYPDGRYEWWVNGHKAKNAKQARELDA